MDLMTYVPYFSAAPNVERIPTIVHNCEEQKEKDELKNLVKGKTVASKLHRWCLRQRILSRKHPLTRWCLKSTTAVNYEVSRHLTSYPYMIHPFSSFRIVWESVITLFAFIALLVTPIFIAFYFDHQSDWHVLNNFINSIFILDIVIWFFTGYYDYRTKVIVLDPRIVATKYLTGSFVIDVVPVLPLELVQSIVPKSIWCCSALNVLKILRMRTIIIYSRRLRDVYRMNFQLYKLLEMTVITIMCVHWAACLEYYVPLSVAKFAGTNDESWIRSPHMLKKTTRLEKYITCVNRATTSLVASGHYLDMKSPEDIILNLILTVVGFLVFLYLLTQFSQLMTTFHSTSKRHLKLIQQLREYMRHKELPQALQRRLLIFYNYRNRKGFERDRQIMNQVSPYLREELILHNYLRLVRSVELFKHLPEVVVARLASALRSEIFMSGDEIVKAGTRGDALYFIACGTVAVYTATGKEVCHLEDGSYFGEIALVMESEHRIATVVAVETCEIYILAKNDFQRFVKPFPDLLNRLQNVALEHLERTLLLEEVYNLESTTTAPNINISSIKGKRRE